jgi:hypothetical protein
LEHGFDWKDGAKAPATEELEELQYYLEAVTTLWAQTDHAIGECCVTALHEIQFYLCTLVLVFL